MKKFLKLIIHNRKNIIKTLVITTGAIVAYEIAHKAGTKERGYEAVGGEIFVPFLVIFAKDIWGIIKAPFKEVRK